MDRVSPSTTSRSDDATSNVDFGVMAVPDRYMLSMIGINAFQVVWTIAPPAIAGKYSPRSAKRSDLTQRVHWTGAGLYSVVYCL